MAHQYIHVMFPTLPMAQAGREGYTFSVIVYSLIFFGYAFFRVRKAVLKKEKYAKKIVVNGALTFTVLIISFITMLALPKNQKNEQPKNEVQKSFAISTTSATETTQTSTKTTTVSTTISTATSVVTDEQTTSETTTEETTTETIIEEIKIETVIEEPQEEQPVIEIPDVPEEPQYI